MIDERDQLAMHIGNQRLFDLRSMASQVEPNKCWLPEMMLYLRNGGGYGWVAVRADDLLALLDTVDAVKARDG